MNGYVTVIQPSDYDLEGVFALFNLNIAKYTITNVVENLWKFLVYAEIAQDLYHDLDKKRQTESLEQAELNLINFVDIHSFIKLNFTTRMNEALSKACNLDIVSPTTEEQSKKISEILHDEVINRLRVLIGEVLKNKRKLYILIDNLDKAWLLRHDLSKLADFLFGLLNVARNITKDFSKDDSKKRKVEIALVVFLRSDIYQYIVQKARERDKLRTKNMNWTDPILLQRLIEERIESSLAEFKTSDEIWSEFFDPYVSGTATKDYLVQRILPRPRDIIFFCGQALIHAINRRHSRIEENDIVQAEKDYSKHARDTLIVEIQSQIEDIDSIFNRFVLCPQIITMKDLEEIISQNLDRKKVINLLIDSNFLGLETQPEEFKFVYDEDLKDAMLNMAEKTKKQIGVERYKIHEAFHNYLQIKI